MSIKYITIFFLISLIFASGCITIKDHNPNLVLHPDQYVIISDVHGGLIEVLIPEYINDGYKMTYYGWVDITNYKGWTLLKKNWRD